MAKAMMIRGRWKGLERHTRLVLHYAWDNEAHGIEPCREGCTANQTARGRRTDGMYRRAILCLGMRAFGMEGAGAGGDPSRPNARDEGDTVAGAMGGGTNPYPVPSPPVPSRPHWRAGCMDGWRYTLVAAAPSPQQSVG